MQTYSLASGLDHHLLYSYNSSLRSDRSVAQVNSAANIIGMKKSSRRAHQTSSGMDILK